MSYLAEFDGAPLVFSMEPRGLTMAVMNHRAEEYLVSSLNLKKIDERLINIIIRAENYFDANKQNN